MLLNLSLECLMDLKTLFVTIVVLLVIYDLIALSFKLLKKSKEMRNLSFLEVLLNKKYWILVRMVCC